MVKRQYSWNFHSCGFRTRGYYNLPEELMEASIPKFNIRRAACSVGDDAGYRFLWTIDIPLIQDDRYVGIPRTTATEGHSTLPDVGLMTLRPQRRLTGKYRHSIMPDFCGYGLLLDISVFYTVTL